MANNLTEKVLSYIETSGEALGVAIKLAESQELAKEKVTGLISSLKTAGLIEDHQEKEASAQLVDPSQTSKYANFAGYRRGSDDAPAASDEALLRLIDGYQPSI